MDAATAHAMCRSILEDLRESHSQIQGAEVNNDQQEATRRLFRNGNLVWITQAIITISTTLVLLLIALIMPDQFNNTSITTRKM